MLDLNESLKNAGKKLRSLMGKDVEIEIVTTSDGALVKAGPGQMDQVLVNLAMNARDAMAGVGRFILETSVVELDENSPHRRSQQSAHPHSASAPSHFAGVCCLLKVRCKFLLGRDSLIF